MGQAKVESQQQQGSHNDAKRALFGAITFLSIFVITIVGAQLASTRIKHDDGNDPPRARSLRSNNITNVKDQRVERLSRAYPKWQGSPEAWCTPPQQYDDSMPTGMLYVKVPKTASTTCAGLNIHIAHRHGRRKFANATAKDDRRCYDFHNHMHAFSKNWINRDKNRSILWTTLRDPSKRAMSHIFFAQVSKTHMEPTDENIVRTLDRKEDDFQLNYIRMNDLGWKPGDKLGKEEKLELAEEAIGQVLDEYNMVALVERLDESLVVMKMLFDFDDGDILYISSKVGGGYESWDHLDTCMKIEKTFVSESVEQYLDSEQWREKNSADFLLYAAANRSLDETIDSLGRSEFEKELARHRWLLESMQSVCNELTDFRCTKDGLWQKELSAKNCYQRDKGCGYPCIEEFVRLHVEENMPYDEVAQALQAKFGKAQLGVPEEDEFGS